MKTGNAKVTLAGVALLDQDGATRSLKGEVLGDRIVVMDFIYTTCTTVCPVISATCCAAWAATSAAFACAPGKSLVRAVRRVEPRLVYPVCRSWA